MIDPIKKGTNVVVKRNNIMEEVAIVVSIIHDSKIVNIISREPYPDGSGTEPASVYAMLVKAIDVSRSSPLPCIIKYGITYQIVCMSKHSIIN